MKLCFICCEYPPGVSGGIGTFVRMLSTHLVTAGHQVRVIGLYERGHSGKDYEEDEGVGVWRLKHEGRRLGWLQGRRRMYQTIVRWAQNGEVDLVEVPDWQGMAAGWPKVFFPVVVRLHGSSTFYSKEIGRKHNWRMYWLEKLALKRADYLCSVSRYTAERTRDAFHLSRGADEIIYNGVEVKECLGISRRNANKVVFAGTLNKTKGIESLIRAWSTVVRRHEKAELHVFGRDGTSPRGGSMTEYLQGLLNEGIKGSVQFHGHVNRDRLIEELGNARVCVFPSRSEAFGLVVTEAMSTGCPTIFTRRASGPELIESEVHGLLVEPDNSDELESAILRLLQDDDLAERLGHAAWERIRNNFSIEAVLPRNIKFFQDCVARFQGGRRVNGERNDH